MAFASRTDESSLMLSVAAQLRAGSHVASAVALAAVDTPRLCPPAPWDRASMRQSAPVDLVGVSVVASVAEVSVAEASVVVVIDSVVVEESVTRVAAVASEAEDKLHLMLLLALVVDVGVDLEVATAVVEEAGLTVV